MKLFLGVDGGQSGTTAVIGGETGRILGTGEAGPVSPPAAMRRLRGRASDWGVTQVTEYKGARLYRLP
jgi:N-acetylglucosamine kinase-like BadF-type ATPase